MIFWFPFPIRCKVDLFSEKGSKKVGFEILIVNRTFLNIFRNFLFKIVLVYPFYFENLSFAIEESSRKFTAVIQDPEISRSFI